jgi:nicotinamide mononucleotide adenylyltransferase
VVGGYFSPTSDAYSKTGLAPWEDRVNMCRLAVTDSAWIDVDDWEACSPDWKRTAVVLDHYHFQLNTIPRRERTPSTLPVDYIGAP